LGLAPGAVTPVGTDVDERECGPSKEPSCPSGLVDGTFVVTVETLVVVA
jgi:hypothetical protein